MEKLQGLVDSCCLFLMARRNSDTDPQREHLIPRIKAGVIQGLIIALVVAGVLGLFQDMFVSKNTIAEKQISQMTSTMEELKVIVITNTTTNRNKMDELGKDFNRLDRRVLKIEGVIEGWEEYNGD